MSRSIDAIGRTGMWLLAAGAIYASGWMIDIVLKADSLDRFRPRAGEAEPPGIRMDQAHFKHYRKGRLVAEADVAVMAVTKDRSNATFNGIENGVFYAQDGRQTYFEGTRANYKQLRRILEVDSGARIYRDEDLDLRTPAFTFDEATHLIEAPGQITGVLKGGEMTAANLVFDTEKDTLSAGPVLWIGKADLQQQDSAKTWELSADETDWPGDGTSVWIHGRATDGEVIVLADKIVHDQETDVLTAEGNVKFFGEDVNLSCPKAVVDRKNQKAVLSGTVEMLIKPEEKKGLKEEEIPPLIPYVPEEVKANRPLPPKSDPERELDDQVRSGESIREYPVSIIAKQIEYWYKEGDRKAVITGSPQARQEMTGGRWRMIWAHHAEYDGEKDWLKLLSRKEERDARFKNSVGDDFKAFHFELSTKKDDDRMSGKGVQGVAQVREDDETGGGTGGGSGLSGRIGA